jgi:hypothetical protein
MATVTAGQAAVLTSTCLVATSRGRCQHLLVAAAVSFTPLGKVRVGHGPVCGLRSRRLRMTFTNALPVCRRCLAWAVRRRPDLANPYLFPEITPGQVHSALLAVTSPAELHLIVHAICSRADLVHHVVLDQARHFGAKPTRRRLTTYVPAARARCALNTPSSRRNRT